MGAVDRPVHLCVAARPWNDGAMNTTTLHAPALNPHRRRWWAPPLLAFSAAWVLGGCAHTPAPVQALPAPVRAALERAGLDASTLAVAVLPVDRPARVGDAVGLLHQADRPMQPASAMKVVTSAVALDRVAPICGATPNCAPPRRSKRAACVVTWCCAVALIWSWACPSCGP